MERAPWAHQKIAADAGLHSLRGLVLADRPTTLPVLPVQPSLSIASDVRVAQRVVRKAGAIGFGHWNGFWLTDNIIQ